MGDKARIGIIGAGWWACLYTIPELQKLARAEVVAVCRPDEGELARVRREFGIELAYTDYRQLLEEARLHGVVVASPHVNHYEHASVALERGLHVVVEKPMCTSAADARRLEELATASNVQLMVPCGWNFKDYTRKAKRLVDGGAIGECRHLIVQMASPLEDLFAGESMLETAEHMYRPPASTWADPARAGGFGWGQLSHGLSMAMHVSGLQPARVSASAVMSQAGVDYYDAATIEFTNGATAVVSGAATLPKGSGYQIEFRVFGTEGMLVLDTEYERMEVLRNDGEHVPNSMRPGEGAYTCAEPYARLVDYCLGECPENDSPVEANRRVVEILDAMYRSFASGQPERV